MLGGQQFRTGVVRELAEPVLEGFDGQLAVQEEVVGSAADQATVLVVLDQVVEAAGEGEAVYPQGV